MQHPAQTFNFYQFPDGSVYQSLQTYIAAKGLPANAVVDGWERVAMPAPAYDDAYQMLFPIPGENGTITGINAIDFDYSAQLDENGKVTTVAPYFMENMTPIQGLFRRFVREGFIHDEAMGWDTTPNLLFAINNSVEALRAAADDYHRRYAEQATGMRSERFVINQICAHNHVNGRSTPDEEACLLAQYQAAQSANSSDVADKNFDQFVTWLASLHSTKLRLVAAIESLSVSWAAAFRNATSFPELAGLIAASLSAAALKYTEITGH